MPGSSLGMKLDFLSRCGPSKKKKGRRWKENIKGGEGWDRTGQDRTRGKGTRGEGGGMG